MSGKFQFIATIVATIQGLATSKCTNLNPAIVILSRRITTF